MAQLGDVFVKLANGTPLSLDEIEFMRLQMNQSQSNNAVLTGWLAGGTTPNFSKIDVDQSHFTVSPLDGGYFYLGQVVTSSDEVDPLPIVSSKIDGNTYAKLNTEYGNRIDLPPIDYGLSNPVVILANAVVYASTPGALTSGKRLQVWLRRADTNHASTGTDSPASPPEDTWLQSLKVVDHTFDGVEWVYNGSIVYVDGQSRGDPPITFRFACQTDYGANLVVLIYLAVFRFR